MFLWWYLTKMLGPSRCWTLPISMTKIESCGCSLVSFLLRTTFKESLSGKSSSKVPLLFLCLTALTQLTIYKSLICFAGPGAKTSNRQTPKGIIESSQNLSLSAVLQRTYIPESSGVFGPRFIILQNGTPCHRLNDSKKHRKSYIFVPNYVHIMLSVCINTSTSRHVSKLGTLK